MEESMVYTFWAKEVADIMKKTEHQRKFAKDNINEAALFEHLAEECSEMAAEASKVARIMRKENPTNANLLDTYKDLVEEYSDVTLLAAILTLFPNSNVIFRKANRLEARVQAMINQLPIDDGI